MHDFALVAIFGGVAVTHYFAEKYFEAKHYHVHWLVWVFHPAVLATLKDWVVHLAVYSKYALIS